MSTRMLIDARHQEETRVAVVKGNKIEEFDFESAEHKQLKGNIYLAKVTRVEPSLQAAFVDYGGNRHGFLAFSEIHPDYYQIPQEDRAKLLAEEAEHAAEEAALREQEEEEGAGPADPIASEATEELDDSVEDVEQDESVDTIDVTEGEVPAEDESDSDDDDDDDESSEGSEENASQDDNGKSKGRGGRNSRGRGGRRRGAKGNVAKASDQARQKRMALRRRYKIQDVIQRRQVVLVQVVKEERGNKGAALTSYLSLAGRYCVLMPNTSHGGGISRKISNAGDRKRLKSIIADMNLPNTMGCIVRTAGLARNKTEIKRDFDYLARLWDEVRENTLGATAPKLIHSDSDLIKRAIRDIYNREIEEVLIEGEDGYKAAKDFMKLLMPSHSRRVKSYADPVSLFQRYGVEDQLSAMYSPEVQLKSGGYLVINPTEALVSIDINSGRSTREHGIEATAVKTNIEAANEIARQLRLRDMAGLVVIDFIDMDRHGNARKVERAMREALKNDRARIQVGRISSFGLMEMSRQRLRTGVLEASTKVCPHCDGTGLVRTASSSALSALRLIEEEAAKGKASVITLTASQEATIYVLNSKRQELADIETRYGVSVEIVPDDQNEGARMEVKASGSPPQNVPKFEPIVDDDDDDQDDVIEADERDEEEKPRKRRRRRGRRGGRGGDRQDGNSNDNSNEGSSSNDNGRQQEGDSENKPKSTSRSDGTPKEDVAVAKSAEGEAEDKPKRRRAPRKKLAGESPERNEAKTGTSPEATSDAKSDDGDADKKPKRRRAPSKKAAEEAAGKADASTAKEEAKPKRASRPRAKNADPKTADGAKADGSKEAVQNEKPKRAPRARAKAGDKVDTAKSPAPKTAANNADGAPDGPGGDGSRKGWWQRTFG